MSLREAAIITIFSKTMEDFPAAHGSTRLVQGDCQLISPLLSYRWVFISQSEPAVSPMAWDKQQKTKRDSIAYSPIQFHCFETHRDISNTSLPCPACCQAYEKDCAPFPLHVGDHANRKPPRLTLSKVSSRRLLFRTRRKTRLVNAQGPKFVNSDLSHNADVGKLILRSGSALL